MQQIEQVIKNIKEIGYGKVEDAVNKPTLAHLLDRVMSLQHDTSNKLTGNVPFLNTGHDMVYNLQNKDLLFSKIILSHPVIRTVLMTFLNDQWYRQIPPDKPNYILRSLLGRSGGPGAMPLHIDSFIPARGSFAWSMQVAVILEDQLPENGCTLVVPGSHLKDRYASSSDLEAAKPLPSKTGDLVFWDSRLWHGATSNTSGKSRWSVIGTFGRWWLKQNYDLPRSLPQQIYAELSNEERAIMGFCSIPPIDEFERIDIKAGYESLRKNVAEYK